jgi:putative transport protein
MIHWLVQTLRTYPEIAIFLTLALGFFVGSLKFGRFTLGSVTGVLLAGVMVGQAHITISPNVKSVFFLMFLFAVGYSVGPQFFRGLKSEGIPYALFALVVCVSCLLCALGAAMVLRYNVGQAAGLLSGACTISAVLGVATDAINQLERSPEEKKVLLDSMPVAYAVTYLFGTAGAAWFLATIGPKVLGGNLVQACKELESKLGAKEAEPGVIPAYARFVARAYRLTDPLFFGKTVDDFERHLLSLPGSRRAFVERIRHGEAIGEVSPTTVLHENDVLALVGSRELLLEHHEVIGPEVEDREVLQFEAEVLDVVVTSKEVIGQTFKQVIESPMGSMTRGVFIRKLHRLDQELPVSPGLEINRGDVLQVVGSRRNVERVVQLFGYADRVTDRSNMVLLALGITIGALVGSLSIKLGRVPLSLSTSGGALVGGLVCGWLRSVHRTFGRIPGPALWVFNNVGLTAFIAVVGITAGPSFFSGLKSAGLSLLLAGIFVTCVPLLIGLLAGKYLFKFHPAINLGACAGARTTTAALGAIQDVCRSKVAALGYTVPYAVGNMLLITWGVVIVALLA